MLLAKKDMIKEIASVQVYLITCKKVQHINRNSINIIYSLCKLKRQQKVKEEIASSLQL